LDLEKMYYNSIGSNMVALSFFNFKIVVGMKSRNSILIFSVCALVLSLTSCGKEEIIQENNDSVLNLPSTPFDYKNINLPTHFTVN